MPQEQARRGKKSKRADRRPAKLRYWAKRTLEYHKIAQLMRWGYSHADALKFWQYQRKGRVPDGYIRPQNDLKLQE